MKVPTHNCNHCNKSLFRTCLGNHYFKHHKDVIKQKLSPYKNSGIPSFPLKIESFYMCLCCHEMWSQHQRAVNHATSKPECSFENQTKALWALLEIDEPKNLTITVKNSITYESLQINDAKKELTDNDAIIKKLHLTVAQLEAENLKLKERLKNDGKHSYESRIKLIETSAHIVIGVLQENLVNLKLQNPSLHSASSELLCDLTSEDNDRINALLMDYKQYNQLYELPKYLRSIYRSEPVVEPVIETIVETVVEPVVEPVIETIVETVVEPVITYKATTPTAIESHTCQRRGCMDSVSPTDFYTKCQSCKVSVCKNNEITGCYMYDCKICDKHICLTCVRANNGIKLNPLCLDHKSLESEMVFEMNYA